MWPTYLRRQHYQMKAKEDLSSLFLMTFLRHCQGRSFPILGTSWRSVYTNQVGGPKLTYHSSVSLRGLDQFHRGELFQPFRRVASDCGLAWIASEEYLKELFFIIHTFPRKGVFVCNITQRASHHVTINTPFIPSTSIIFNPKHIKKPINTHRLHR